MVHKDPFPVDDPPKQAEADNKNKDFASEGVRSAYGNEKTPKEPVEVSKEVIKPSGATVSQKQGGASTPPAPSEALISEKQTLRTPPAKDTMAIDQKGKTKPATPPVKREYPKGVLIAVFILIIGIVAFFVVRQRLGNLGETLFGRKGEIVWWGFRDEGEIYKTVIEEYRKEHPNMKISYQRQSPIEYRERLTNALASGKGPDIFEIHNSWIPMFTTDLEPSPIGKNEFSRLFYPVIVSDLTSGENVLAAPLEFDALTLFVNEDVFASAADIPPKTWDELRSLAIELTQKDGNKEIIQAGVALGLTENVDHWQEIVALMMIQNGANFTESLDERTEDAISFYNSFSKKYGVWDSKLPKSTNAFAIGRTAMYFAPAWRAYEITQINPNLKFRTVELPQLPKNEPNEPDFSYATYWVQAVWTKSANKKEAWDFLNFLMSEQSLKEINNRNKMLRGAERLYPKPDMNINYREHPILGSVMRLAYSAKSWYLADATNDGETGINTQISNIFSEEMQANKLSLSDLESSVQKVLSQYLR